MIMYSVSINILWPWLTQNMMRKREERDAYPHLAVREGILNAIVHRDYTDNNQINLNIYADRLEIINPGTFPEGITVNTLSKPHTSVVR